MVSEILEFGSAYAVEQLRRSRHPLRRLIKKFYLDRVLRELRGPTIDFGCGAGQLLARLPADSVGLEVNPPLVQCGVDRVDAEPTRAGAEDNRRRPEVHPEEVGLIQVDAELAVERLEPVA